MENTVQGCLDALEQGYRIICWDSSALYKRPDGTYVYVPFLVSPLVATMGMSHETASKDLESLLAVILLREAVIDPVHRPVYAPSVVVSERVVEMDAVFVPYKEKIKLEKSGT
jgi:hypothetical protein